MSIEKVRMADEGSYTCECSNAAGRSSQEHRLEVHGEPGRGWGRRRHPAPHTFARVVQPSYFTSKQAMLGLGCNLCQLQLCTDDERQL